MANLEKKLNVPKRTKNFYSAFDLKPTDIRNAIKEAELGRPERYYEILDHIKVAFGDLETRKLALLSFGRKIKGENEEQIKFVESALKRIDYFGLVSLWLDSIYYGFKVIEIYYESKGQILPIGYDDISQFYNIQDWSSFNELFGIPFRLGKYNDNTTKDQIDDLETTVHDMGSDASGVVHESCEIEFKEAQKYSSVNTFETFDVITSKKISQIILGETLTSDIQKGSYAAAKVHNGVRVEKILSDARFFSSGFTEQFIQPLLSYNFASPDKTIELSHGVEELENIISEGNQLLKAQTYREIYDMGAGITEAQLQREFRIDPPKDGEPVVKKPATGLAGMLG
jgi:phage gp29-like protein